MKRLIALSVVIALGCQYTLKAQQVIVAASGSIISVQSGAIVYVNGGVSLDDRSKLFNEGSVTINQTGTSAADFKDISATSYQYGGGKFLFSGTGIQHLQSANYFGQIELNNGGLDLASDISSVKWTLNSGRINTGAFHAIVLSTDANAFRAGQSNEGFSNSWINGNLRRYVNPNSVNSYVFPIGDERKVNIAQMDDLEVNPLTGIQFINASFTSKPGNDQGLNISLPGKALTSICNEGIWRLVPDVLPMGGNYTLKLFINGFAGAENSDYSIVRRPLASYNAGEWVIPSGDPGAVLKGRYASRNRVDAFGQFGIGIITRVAPIIDYTNTIRTNSLKVFPNPVINNEFYVAFKGGKIKAIKLLADDGKTVACNFNLQKQGQLKVTLPVFLSKGIYTLQLDTENGTESTLISLQ